jgi:Arc/MetJ-type ribon-helix-helix transcriptional regulator
MQDPSKALQRETKSLQAYVPPDVKKSVNQLIDKSSVYKSESDLVEYAVRKLLKEEKRPLGGRGEKD